MTTPAGSRVLVAVAVVVGLLCGVLATSGGFVDLEVYRFGGAALLDDGRLYTQGTPGSGLPFTYPPFAALVMAPLAALPFPAAVALWSAASVLALAAALAGVLVSVGRRPEPRALAALVVATLSLEPVWANLSFAQVNLFLMALLLHDLLHPDRRYAGVLVGLVAGLKLTPLVFVFFLLVVGRRRMAARAVAAFAATVGVGFLVAPDAAVAYWTHVLWDAGRVGGVAYAGNQSMMGFLSRAGGTEPSTVVWFLAAGTATLAMMLVAGRAWRHGHEALGACLAALGMLIASPISWSHHWVWAAPLAVVLLDLGRVRVAAAWLMVFASTCIWWPPNTEDAELGWSVGEHVVGNAYLVAALLVTAYAAGRVVRGSRSGTSGATSADAHPLRPRGGSAR